MAGSDEDGLDLRLPWGSSAAPPKHAVEPVPAGPGRNGDPSPKRSKAASGGRPLVGLSVQAPTLDAGPGPTDVAAASAEQLAMVIDESLQSLVGRVSDRIELLERQAAANLEARIDAMEARMAVAHDAAVGVVGLLAGQLLAGLEEQVTRVEAAIEARNEQLVVHVAAVLSHQHDELMAWLDLATAEIKESGASQELA